MNASQFAALAFLAALAAAPVVATIIALRRCPMNPVQCLLWATAYLLCRLLWRARWEGRLPVAEDQGAIIVCNHKSSVDPFFIQSATSRKTHWLVAREYCQRGALGWFLRTSEVIPVSRGGIDTAAIKAAIQITSRGGLVGMLPEGRINMTTELLLAARPGAALVALKARVPVVPCFIQGSPYRRYLWSPLLMPARAIVRFSQPLDLSEFYGREQEDGVLEEAMRRILKAIAALAGQPDYEPQIAGRNWKPTEEEIEAAIAAAEARSQETGVRGQESGETDFGARR